MSGQELPTYRPDGPGAQPANDTPAYKSTIKRHPNRAPIRIAQTLTEITGPSFGKAQSGMSREAKAWYGKPLADLTRQHKSEPLGERIILAGKVLDEDGKPVPNTLVELWQCNAAGRYAHPRDQHDAPLDKNFTGFGQVVTDAQGDWRFVTIKPGHYPWRNTHNAWRAQHIHFSIFGPAFATRIVTQMYFPGDPLLADDPIYNAVPDIAGRQALIARYAADLSQPEWALGFRWDIVLRGRNATPREN